MALTDFQAKATELIMADPQAFTDMQRHLRRIDPKIPIHALPDVHFEERLEQMAKPLKEKIEALEKQVKEKSLADTREAQWDSLRKLGWSDEQIVKHEERMSKDPDNNFYGSYLAAAKYYQSMDQPTLPTSSSRVSPVSGRPVNELDWKEKFPTARSHGDPKHALLSKDQRERKRWAAEEAAKAKANFRNR
jgi:hypothetical protein